MKNYIEVVRKSKFVQFRLMARQYPALETRHYVEQPIQMQIYSDGQVHISGFGFTYQAKLPLAFYIDQSDNSEPADAWCFLIADNLRVNIGHPALCELLTHPEFANAKVETVGPSCDTCSAQMEPSSQLLEHEGCYFCSQECLTAWQSGTLELGESH